MASPAIAKVHVDCYSRTTGKCSVGWSDADGNLFHFWTFIRTDGNERLLRREEIVYKNAPSSAPGAYPTRRLDISSGPTSAMVRLAMEVVHRDGLFLKLIDADTAERVRVENENREAMRIAHVMECGPRLLESLKELHAAALDPNNSGRMEHAMHNAIITISVAEQP